MTQNMNEGERILIADDDETFRNSTAALLGREHYECVCAPDATTTAELLHVAAFDLLIADIKMPGNLNLELIRNITNSETNIPVVLMTGYPSLHSALESFQLPVVAYLVKPFELDDLLAVVDKAMASARLSRVARSMSQRLQDWHQDLGNVLQVAETDPKNNSAAGLEAFLTLTQHNIADCLTDLTRLSVSPGGQSPDTQPAPVQNGSSPNGRPTDASETVPLSRVKQLEETLRSIAHDLTLAGIGTDLAPPPLRPEVLAELRHLSSREWEILRSLLTGQRVPTIARSFYISPHTVRNHLKSIFRKLGVGSQAELLERVRQQPLQ